MLMAQGVLAGYSLLQLLVIVIVIAAAVAIVGIALSRMGVAFPPWAVQIFWVLVVAFVAIVALVFLFRVIAAV